MATACSRGGDTGGNEASVSIPDNPPPITSLSQIKAPMASYILSPEDAATLQNAVIIVANKCSLRFGVVSSQKPDNVRLPSDALELDGRYSTVVSLDGARQYGYQQDPRYAVKVDDKEKVKDAAPANPKEREVFNGVTADGQKSSLKDKNGNLLPQGGCYGEGNAEIQDHEKDYWADLIHLSSDGLDNALDRLDNDSRLLDAEKKWAACMKTKGYTFTHKDDAVQSVAGKPRAQQVKVAVDDATCSQQINYYGIMYALDTAYQNQYIVAHQAQFTSAQNGVRKALVTARGIIAKG